MTTCRAVVIDTETTGLDPATHHVWELAAIEVHPDGSRGRALLLQVEHDRERAAGLPESFAADYHARFDPGMAVSVPDARAALLDLFGDDRPTFVAAVPSFDASFVAKLLDVAADAVPWSHRLRCVETLTAGRVGFDPGGLASCLAALDLPPNNAPHTANADADAAARLWSLLACRPPDPSGVPTTCPQFPDSGS